MAQQKYTATPLADFSTATSLGEAPFLQPPPGRQYVRSFLFSRRVDAPLSRVHLITRVVLILCLSAAQLRAMNTAHPDLLGALVLLIPSLLIFVGCGMKPLVARIYLLLALPTLISLFLAWTIFNPVPGTVVVFQHVVYHGVVTLSLSLWQPLWLAVVVGYYWWRRGIINGLLLATLLILLVTRVVAFPTWVLGHVPFFHPLAISVTDRGLLLALTKVVSYLGMVLSTMALVVTSRDVELIGALRQLRLPQPVIFFISTMFRALNLALTDYETIHQAQIARAINAQPRSFWRRLRDLASIAVPMVAMMIRRSSEIGDALLARGYSLRQPQVDFYETTPFRWLDWLLLGFSLLLLLMAVGPFPGLTALLQRG
ncbi:energy-coupling factor transporter transmembrane protein EcfT [Ktedonobacteria bacterium brp13]|nr:energy-coupling factor transporter transmembrane protein EcfT [Ktedonobacteria bacterium brp13]